MSIQLHPFVDKFYPIKLEIGRNQLYRLYGATICDNQKLNQHNYVDCDQHNWSLRSIFKTRGQINYKYVL